MTAKKAKQDELSFPMNKRLPFRIYIGYALGHVLNDVCAAMWFSYLLVFFHLVLGFKSGEAGVLLLVGQVADAVATPFIGYNSDKDHHWWIYRFGKRKIWYFMGSICVVLTFPFIFSPCISCQTASRLSQMIYYSFFIVFFQFGWAAVQIAHMSLMPEITSNEHQRTKLAAVRNGATVVASVLVYLVTWGVLQISGGSDKKIGAEDAARFQHIVWSVMVFGIVCSILFYIMIKEPLATKSGNEENYIAPISFKKIFLNPNLYLVGTVYMTSRLFINLTQVFISLYLSESLDMVASSLALVPLAIYIASFVASIPVGPITNLAGRKLTYVIGAILGICGCLWIHWGQGNNFKTYYIFVVSALLGSASTIVLVSSLDITTSLIGSKTSRGAFIYGIMSFADKLSNGVAVKVIQDVHNEDDHAGFYQDIMTYVCGGVLILGAAVVSMVNNRERKERHDMRGEAFRTSISTIT
uniref:Major facilitator superfamily (MFS) profile domain-containing protein n=1 Tax=Dendroctonus ponderosae TaxID=77166 RepID=J3JWL9_DENPD|nr:unknown [Dendroctonus ponderosae]